MSRTLPKEKKSDRREFPQKSDKNIVFFEKRIKNEAVSSTNDFRSSACEFSDPFCFFVFRRFPGRFPKFRLREALKQPQTKKPDTAPLRLFCFAQKTTDAEQPKKTGKAYREPSRKFQKRGNSAAIGNLLKSVLSEQP